ncbi:hypothetical protein [Fibrella arboris]|uniref:hypothetical protein n=1 Tax=Fibrella arboris TaxID=3242486 RepID=UPI00351F8D0F
MHHVQDFKANFEEPVQDRLELDRPVDPSTSVIELHSDESSVRNLCFVWLDGRKAFFNYAYLVAAEFNMNTKQSVIKLDFSSYSINLYGYMLETLFMAFLDHLPRTVMAIDQRYTLIAELNIPVVVDILIEGKAD